MNTTYFSTCRTPDDVKVTYRNLALKHHPDCGGDTRTMQDINAAYLEALKHLDGFTSQGATDDRPHVYHYNQDTEQSVMDKIDELLKANLPSHVTIELLGTWIWVSGTRKDDLYTREQLKNAKFMWHSKRCMWYWKPGEYHSRYNRHASFDDLRSFYGSRDVEHEHTEYEMVQ